MTTHHYVYHSFEEWGREYIGVRSCDCLPEEDTKYFGSFSDKSFNPTEKTILFVCETRKEAAGIEIKLHDFFDVAVNPQFANRAKATSIKFDTTGTGKTHTEETKKKLSVAKSGEKHPRFGLFGALNPTSKAVIAIEPDGTQRHYGGGREAARELKMNSGSLCIYLNEGHVLTRGPYKNWRFVFDLTPVYENKWLAQTL